MGVSDEKKNKDLKDMIDEEINNIVDEEYDERFSEAGKQRCIEIGLPARIANRFNKRFSAEEICCLCISNVFDKFANSFPDNFDYNDIIIFNGNKINAEKTKEYPGFSGYEIALIEKVKQYCPNVDYEKYFHPDRNTEGHYGHRWSSLMFVSSTFSENYSTINDYIKSSLRYENSLVIKQFNEMDLLFLAGKYVSPDSDLEELTAFELGILSRAGLHSHMLLPGKFEYPNLEETKKKNIFLKNVIKFLGMKSCPDDFRLLGTGYEGIVWLKENTVMKLSPNASYEMGVHRELITHHQKSLKNVINAFGHIKNSWINVDSILLENIEGSSLQNIIIKCNVFYHKSYDVLKIGGDITNGLKEIREAGFYHRDIKPANILIEYYTRRAIIIDLGIATEDPNEITSGNRAYGGNNDLISLGQTLYETYTGKNLFNEKLGFNAYFLTKNNIQTEREKVYDDPEKLKEIFAKVRKDIEGNLGDIIIYLLDDDLWTQPALEKVCEVKKVFEAYLNET